ncbi:hypothetical protein, partial [Helicobacter heilmannii]
PLKPYGLSKIVEKHIDDFSPFAGDTPLEKLGNGIEEIIKDGELVTDQAGVKTIILKDNGKEFRVGISQGWEHEGKNYWIVTAYHNKKASPAQKFDQDAAKLGHGSDLAQKDATNPTTQEVKSQENTLARVWGDSVSAEPEEIATAVKRTYTQNEMRKLEWEIGLKTQWIKDAKNNIKVLEKHLKLAKEGKEYFTQEVEDTFRANQHLRSTDYSPQYFKALKEDRELFIKQATQELEENLKRLERYQNNLISDQEDLVYQKGRIHAKQTLTPLEELKIKFYNEEKLTEKGLWCAESRNKDLMKRHEGLKGELKDSVLLKFKDGINHSVLYEDNFPTLRERFKSLEGIVRKLEKINPKSITPKMRAKLEQIEAAIPVQEEQLREFAKYHELFVKRWEKLHGRKIPGDLDKIHPKYKPYVEKKH